MGIEAELKYAVVGKVLPEDIFGNSIIVPFCGSMRKKEMHTRYLDTMRGEARKRGLALRVRRENEESVFTAKCRKRASGAMSVRHEWNVLSEDYREAVALLEEAGAPCAFLRGKELVTTAEVRFTRLEADVSPREKFSFVLSYDKGIFGTDVPFEEIELELKKGSEEELLDYGKKLLEILPIREEKRSKFVRAMEYSK